jgi:hypothetical protein
VTSLDIGGNVIGYRQAAVIPVLSYSDCSENPVLSRSFKANHRSAGLRNKIAEGVTNDFDLERMETVPPSRARRNIEAPISPGLYEVRFAGSGALHSFGAVDNVAQALSMLSVSSKSWFARREPAEIPDLEYRTCASSSRADAKAAAERMIGRRETYMSGAA